MDRSAGDLFATFARRITALEKRKTFLLPSRLTQRGQQVTDWNDAVASGFYWGLAAANAPSGVTNRGETIGTWFQGFTTVGNNGALYQEVHESQSTRFPIVYRRYWNGTSFGAWQEDDPRDTGFVDLSSMFISPATAASVTGHRVGRQVVLSGNVTGPVASGVVTDLMLITNTLFRPSTLNGGSGNSWGACYISGAYVGAALMRTNGTLAIMHRAGATQTGVHQFTIKFDA